MAEAAGDLAEQQAPKDDKARVRPGTKVKAEATTEGVLSDGHASSAESAGAPLSEDTVLSL